MVLYSICQLSSCNLMMLKWKKSLRGRWNRKQKASNRGLHLSFVKVCTNSYWKLFGWFKKKNKNSNLYIPKNVSILRSCETGSSINWSPFTTKSCSRENTSSHRCICKWYIDMVNGRYASLTVPFGSMASSSNVLYHWNGISFRWGWPPVNMDGQFTNDPTCSDSVHFQMVFSDHFSPFYDQPNSITNSIHPSSKRCRYNFISN